MKKYYLEYSGITEKDILDNIENVIYNNSFEKYIIDNKTIATLIQMAKGAFFKDATVDVCAFVFGNQYYDKKGQYIRLDAFKGDMEVQKQMKEITDLRRSQVGSGDRSERIRTYNFPQGRVSDHRIGLTLYKIEQIMNGDLDEIIDALITADTAEKLKANE